MKVLFLDIDGVLNCATSNWQHRGFIGIDPYMVAILNRVLEKTGAQVVLSSTWRLGEQSREEVRQQVVDFIDVTPSLRRPSDKGFHDYPERGLEVKDWLDRHPEVTCYAILDDDSDFLPDQPLFKTTWEEGLTQEIADKIVAHLGVRQS